MPKVFILNRGAHDYSPAEHFGELVVCTEGALPRDDPQLMFRKLEPFIKSSTAADMILLTSLSSLCSVACAMFAHRHGQLNLLLFHDGSYLKRTIVLN